VSFDKLVSVFRDVRDSGKYKNPKEVIEDLVEYGVVSTEKYIIHAVIVSEEKLALAVDDLINVIVREVFLKDEVERAVNEAWK